MLMRLNNLPICLIFDMHKVGIVGSSYSVGNHHNKETGENNLALPFETWLEKYTTNMMFVNSACSSKGTELYLNKIVYLKEKHNIDVLLMELVNNRSELNFKCLTEPYLKIKHVTDMSIIEDDVYRNSASAYEFMRALTQDMEEEWFSKTRKTFQHWKETQEQMAANHMSPEFWGMLDVYQAIKLCKLLDIKVVTWHKSWDFYNYPGFKSMLQKSLYIDFDGTNAHDYYTKKYPDKDITCDGNHFNDETNEEMIRDFIAPNLERIK